MASRHVIVFPIPVLPQLASERRIQRPGNRPTDGDFYFFHVYRCHGRKPGMCV